MVIEEWGDFEELSGGRVLPPPLPIDAPPSAMVLYLRGDGPGSANGGVGGPAQPGSGVQPPAVAGDVQQRASVSW